MYIYSLKKLNFKLIWKSLEFVMLHEVPSKPSSLSNGYWVQAARYACSTKKVTQQLAKAVGCYWYNNSNSFKTKVLKVYNL